MFFKNHILFFVLLCTLLLFSQCNKDKVTDDTYFGSKIMILGHRGMGINYKMPGNTIESVNPATNIGLDGCELDVQLTKDTVLVFFHDHLLKPTTTCTGRIYESNWSDIKQCEYYSVENNVFINSVDELFSNIPNINNFYFSFDCGKVDTDVADLDLYMNQYLRAIKRICEKYNMSNNVFIEANYTLLKKAQELGLTNKLFLYTTLNTQNIEDAYNNSFFGISLGLSEIKTNSDEAHNKGLYVMCWAPDNFAENQDALNKKVDIIQTDDPISILKYLNRYNYEYIIP